MILEEFSLHARQHMTSHSHRSLHLCLVTDGAFEERARDGRLECLPGTIRISPGHARHNLTAQSTGAQGRLIVLNYRAESGLAQPLQSSLLLSTAHQPSAVEELDTAWQVRDLFRIECAALELAAAAVGARSPAAPDWLDELRSEIDSRLDHGHSLSSLGARFGRHRAHVARAFRNRFGRSIGEHLRAGRVYQSLPKLRHTDQPVAALALDLGFYDQSHFTRMFRRHMGTTPDRYRRSFSTSG